MSKKVPKKTPISQLPREERAVIRAERKERVTRNKRIQVHQAIMRGQFGPKARFKFQAKGYEYTQEELDALAKWDAERKAIHERHLAEKAAGIITEENTPPVIPKLHHNKKLDKARKAAHKAAKIEKKLAENPDYRPSNLKYIKKYGSKETLQKLGVAPKKHHSKHKKKQNKTNGTVVNISTNKSE